MLPFDSPPRVGLFAHQVDTLGTITLLASDKTGTLTMNRMTVVEVWMNGKRLSAQGARDAQASFGSPPEVCETVAVFLVLLLRVQGGGVYSSSCVPWSFDL